MVQSIQPKASYVAAAQPQTTPLGSLLLHILCKVVVSLRAILIPLEILPVN